MEEKNNAIVKEEKISKKSGDKTPAEELKEEIKKPKKSTNKSVNGKKDLSKSDAKVKDKKAKAKEKEKIREEKARLKAAKKEAKNAKKAAKKEALNAKIEEFKVAKLKKKEERKERRDLLKHESREEKRERIAREKQAKRDEKAAKKQVAQQKREERAALKREKLQAKRDLKMQKRELKYQNRKDKRGRGVGGWLAAVIALGCSVLVLGTLFTLSLTTNLGGNDNMFEGSVERTFYDFVSYVDNMDVNLSKLMVSGDEGEQQKILSEINLQANLASNDVTELPLKDESKYYTTKFVNQVGDFTKYLNYKLIDGEKLNEKDWQNINNLYTVNNSLKQELTALSAEIGEDFKFISMMSDGSDNIVLKSFTTLEEGAVDYPKMIYDGPFSDSLETVEPKGLSGEEVSTAEVEDIFKSVFKNYSFDTVEVLGEVNGKIPCYAVEGTSSDDVSVYAEISKVGGKLVMFNSFQDCDESNYDLTSCIQIADAFLESAGFKNMKAVWTTESASTVYLNYVYETNGVIVYPDMVKITVCQERGEVSAFDATEYYLNHTKRTVGKAKIGRETAMKNLSTNIDVETVRLAVIPKGQSKEILAYEISGKFNGATYYVYVDATTGKETQIFRVVETTEGTLLM